MLNIFKPLPIYIKVYRNRIEIINLETGDSSSGTAINSFSTDRQVVSNWTAASELINDILRDMNIKKLTMRSLKVLIQQMENFEGGLSDIEKRALRDLGEQAGGRFVIVAADSKTLITEEALELLKKK